MIESSENNPLSPPPATVCHHHFFLHLPEEPQHGHAQSYPAPPYPPPPSILGIVVPLVAALVCFAIYLRLRANAE